MPFKQEVLAASARTTKTQGRRAGHNSSDITFIEMHLGGNRPDTEFNLAENREKVTTQQQYSGQDPVRLTGVKATVKFGSLGTPSRKDLAQRG